MKWAWIAGVLLFDVFFWVLVYILQKQSKAMGVTEQTDKYFFEPIVNLGVLMTLCCLAWIYTVLV